MFLPHSPTPSSNVSPHSPTLSSDSPPSLPPSPTRHPMFSPLFLSLHQMFPLTPHPVIRGLGLTECKIKCVARCSKIRGRVVIAGVHLPVFSYDDSVCLFLCNPLFHRACATLLSKLQSQHFLQHRRFDTAVACASLVSIKTTDRLFCKQSWCSTTAVSR